MSTIFVSPRDITPWPDDDPIHSTPTGEDPLDKCLEIDSPLDAMPGEQSFSLVDGLWLPSGLVRLLQRCVVLIRFAAMLFHTREYLADLFKQLLNFERLEQYAR